MMVRENSCKRFKTHVEDLKQHPVPRYPFPHDMLPFDEVRNIINLPRKHFIRDYIRDSHFNREQPLCMNVLTMTNNCAYVVRNHTDECWSRESVKYCVEEMCKKIMNIAERHIVSGSEVHGSTRKIVYAHHYLEGKFTRDEIMNVETQKVQRQVLKDVYNEIKDVMYFMSDGARQLYTMSLGREKLLPPIEQFVRTQNGRLKSLPPIEHFDPRRHETEEASIILSLKREDDERRESEVSRQKNLDVKKDERFYQNMMEKRLGGRHMKLPCGVTDITTDVLHVELKEWKFWKSGLGQLCAYNADCPRSQLHLYLFGVPTTEPRVIVQACKNQSIDVYHLTTTEDKGDIVIQPLMSD